MLLICLLQQLRTEQQTDWRGLCFSAVLFLLQGALLSPFSHSLSYESENESGSESVSVSESVSESESDSAIGSGSGSRSGSPTPCLLNFHALSK